MTDEQAFAAPDSNVDRMAAPIYTFNISGDGVGHLPSGHSGRYTFGGLNDAAFVAIEALERDTSVDWPF